MIVARTRARRRHSRVNRKGFFNIFKRVKDKLMLSDPHFFVDDTYLQNQKLWLTPPLCLSAIPIKLTQSSPLSVSIIL
jgi:hypothetical protein